MIVQEQKAIQIGEQVKHYRRIIFEPLFWRFTRPEDIPAISNAINQAISTKPVVYCKDTLINDRDIARLAKKVKAYGMLTSVTFWQQLELSSSDAVHLVAIMRKTIDDKIADDAHKSNMILAEWSSPNAQKVRRIRSVSKAK